jgi:hypothetical protein
MVGTGHLPDFKAGRDLIRGSFAFRTFTPENRKAWEAAFLKFRKVTGLDG